jgi:hypothetical protein
VGTPLERPPFLIARVIDDGPGRRYLESSCDPAQFEICKYKDRVLSQKYFAGDSVLFRREIEGGGVYMIEPMEVRERLRAQELAFAREAVLTYPLDQLRASAKNAARLLVQAKLDEIGSQLTYSYQNYAAAIGWPGTDAMLDSLPGIATCKQNPRARCGNLNIRIVRSSITQVFCSARRGWSGRCRIYRPAGLSVSKLTPSMPLSDDPGWGGGERARHGSLGGPRPLSDAGKLAATSHCLGCGGFAWISCCPRARYWLAADRARR